MAVQAGEFGKVFLVPALLLDQAGYLDGEVASARGCVLGHTLDASRRSPQKTGPLPRAAGLRPPVRTPGIKPAATGDVSGSGRRGGRPPPPGRGCASAARPPSA